MDTNDIYAGKIVPKTMLAKAHQKDKVNWCTRFSFYSSFPSAPITTLLLPSITSFPAYFLLISTSNMPYQLNMHAHIQMTMEIDIHRGLSHAHIVGFHGFFEDKNHVYILLELCRRR